MIVTLVGTINDWQKEKQFIKLNAQNEDAKLVRVKRNGVLSEKNYKIADLLVGDLVIIERGMIIPADGVVISGFAKCDESSVTGESDRLKKLALEGCIKEKKEYTKGKAAIDESTVK